MSHDRKVNVQLDLTGTVEEEVVVFKAANSIVEPFDVGQEKPAKDEGQTGAMSALCRTPCSR